MHHINTAIAKQPLTYIQGDNQVTNVLTCFQESHSTSATAKATKARSISVFIVERAHTQSVRDKTREKCAISKLPVGVWLCRIDF